MMESLPLNVEAHRTATSMFSETAALGAVPLQAMFEIRVKEFGVRERLLSAPNASLVFLRPRFSCRRRPF